MAAAARADLAEAIVEDARMDAQRIFALCREYIALSRDRWLFFMRSLEALMSRQALGALNRRAEDLVGRAEALYVSLVRGPMGYHAGSAHLEAYRRAADRLGRKQLDIDRMLDLTRWSEDVETGRMADIAGLLRALLLYLRAPSMEPLALPPDLALLEPLGRLATRAEGAGEGRPPPPPPPLTAAAAASLREPHRSLAMGAAQLASPDHTVGSRLTEPGMLRRYLVGDAEHGGPLFRLPAEFVARVFDRTEELLRLPEGSGERLRAVLTNPDSPSNKVLVRNLGNSLFDRPVTDPGERRRVAELMEVWRILVLLDLRV